MFASGIAIIPYITIRGSYPLPRLPFYSNDIFADTTGDDQFITPGDVEEADK